MEKVLHFYKSPGLSLNSAAVLISKVTAIHPLDIVVTTELCYNIGVSSDIIGIEKDNLIWLLSECFKEDNLSQTSWLTSQQNDFIIEVGPRLNFATAFSTNAVSICHSIGLKQIQRIEMSRRYLFTVTNLPSNKTLNEIRKSVSSLIFDKMTEVEYIDPLQSFKINIQTEKVYDIDIMGKGRDALQKANVEMGLAFDDWDLEYYTKLFMERLKRNPTNVECFDLAQSNSEHCRHWYFKGEMVIRGKPKDKSLMDMVCDTQKTTNQNNVIKFSDNSSAIEGYNIDTLIPANATTVSSYEKKNKKRHILFTAETHNFPTGVAPFPGATTGTGGRIRDTHAAGKGSHVIAGTAGYCFGNLNIPGYALPWEDVNFKYASNFASPLSVAVEASNGASDYGNKFGEPVITGFSRSFGLILPNGERQEWIKPIMFSGGIGSIEAEHVSKMEVIKGMKVLKVGGPIYRIGVGGGAASSIQVQGDNAEELDFAAVQRGDPEMEQKLNRLIRACIELGENNPICSIHDQGAGGNGNVLKEICEPAGAVIRVKDFILGDPTLSLLEIWGAEYQESDAILIFDKDVDVLKRIAEREKVAVCFVGDITGDNRIVLEDTRDCHANGLASINDESALKKVKLRHAVDLPLDVVLGKMPPKTFNLESCSPSLIALELPASLTVRDALERVLRLPSVASKRYLTNKVDRSVTGLVAQQQCVGPFHTPLADVAVIALSHFDYVGGATSIGEQPIKCLVDPGKGARLTVAEAFTNLIFAKISNIKDVKCSGNWMWPAKLHGEGARLYEACEAMCDMFSALGAAVDGGKDSLSMAARVNDNIVKSPGALVVSLYAPCPDIRLTLTPDLKKSGNALLYIKMTGSSQWQLGGSALAQVFQQVGDNVPDVHNVQYFSKCFATTQSLISKGLLVSGHDVSDGGLITTLLEMSFAGNLGFEVNIDDLMSQQQGEGELAVLFSEEPAIVLEVSADDLNEVMKTYSDNLIKCVNIGQVNDNCTLVVNAFDNVVLKDDVMTLRTVWEATSFQLERLQCNSVCVEEEEKKLSSRSIPRYALSFTPQPARLNAVDANRPKVAVIREEGSNGDREMASCLFMAGFDVYDVTMQDLCSAAVTLDAFQGLVFVGGFSYADVFGSAKGWASLARFNLLASKELQKFREREDTFSLGVCNGCQLMGLLGWIGSTQKANAGLLSSQGVCFTSNVSERFESRFVNVKIEESPSVMLKGMANSTLGIWVAHGEGRPVYKGNDVYAHLIKNKLAPIRYVNDEGEATTMYPLNPNGSIDGIAALCSDDGRHLAMMPHPERCFMMWQWPWLPSEWKSLPASPWLQMFHNAYHWCMQNKI